MGWLGRPSSYPSANEGGFTTRRLLISSISFWLSLSALGFIFLIDFNVTPDLQLSPFASWQNIESFLYCLIVFALVATLIGTIGALPSALVNKIFNPQIESLYRRSWSLPKARIVFFKYSSLALLIISNFLLLSLSLGTAPQYARGRANQPGIIATWSQFIYDLLYVPRLRHRGQEAVAKLNSQNSAKTYVVFVPSSILSQPDVFVRVRKEIGEPIPFLADAPDFSTQMIQMLEGSPDFYQTYNTPILTREILSPERSDLSLATMLNLSEPQLNLRLAPEFAALQSILTYEKKLPAKEASHPPDSESDGQIALKKRLVLSQPHLFLPFRLGLGELFDKSWEWTNLVADDSIEIIDTINRQSSAKSNQALTIIQLDELEQTPTSLFHPYASLRWPVISSLLEKQKIVSRSDELLSLLAAAIKKLGQTSLFILPYPDLKTTRQFAWAFVYLPDEHLFKTRFDKNLKTYGWLTGLATADYLRTSVLNGKWDDDASPNNDTLCQPMLYAFGKNDATQTLQHAWSFVSLDANQNFTVASDLRFLFKTRSHYAIFCKNVVTEAAPYRANGYIFQFLSDETLNLGEKQLLAALFQPSTKLELNSDKKSKTKEPARTSAETQAAIASKLKVYRVIEQDFRQFDVSPLAESQVESVMKTYYNDFIKVSLDISHGQLFWD